MQRNTIEVEFNGKKIGFKCGPLAIAHACRESNNKTIQDLIQSMAKGDLLTILSLFYGSAIQYGNIGVTMDKVSDWMEEMGEENAQLVTDKLLETFRPKNQEAPQEGAKLEATQ